MSVMSVFKYMPEDPASRREWLRYELPVELRCALRSWMDCYPPLCRFRTWRYDTSMRIQRSAPVKWVMSQPLVYRVQCWWWDNVRPSPDSHLGCYSWPCCSEAPQGCSHVTKDPEPYGHRH